MNFRKSALILAAFFCFISAQSQVTYTISHPANVQSCERYQVQLTINGLTAGQALNIRVKNNVNSRVDEVLNDVFVTSGAYTQWDTVSSGSQLVLTYYNQMLCSSLENSLNDVDLDVMDSIYVNNVGKRVQFQIVQPKISYASGYNSLSGDVAENLPRTVIYKNLSAYTFNGYVELVDSLPANVSLAGYAFQYATVLSYLQSGTKHRFVLRVNQMDFGDSMIYKPQYSISNCNYVSGQSRLRVKLGCDTLSFCKLINQNNSLISKVVKNANIVGSMLSRTDISAPGCNIEKRWKMKMMYINKGNRNATNINAILYRASNVHSFGIVDPTTVRFTLKSQVGQITRSVVRTVQTNFCENATSASTRFNGVGYNDTIGTFVRVNQMMPNDTLFIEYELYRCCITDDFSGYNFSNVPTQNLTTANYTSGGVSSAIYYIANPCIASYSSTSIGDVHNGISMSQYSNCTVGDVQGRLPDGTSPGEDFETSMINMTFSNTLFAPTDTNYEYWVRIDSEQGLYSEDSVYYETTSGSRWYPYSLSTIAGMHDSLNLQDDFIHERWAKFRLSDLPVGKTVNDFMRNNSELKFKMQSYCPAKEPKTEYRVTTFLKETDCQSCLMPIYENRCRVNVHCPGCLLPGTIIASSKVRRETFGLADLDNNRRPDASMTEATSKVLLNRVAYGDTLVAEMSINFWDAGYPYNLDNFDLNGLRLDKAFAITKIPAASGFTVLESKIYFNGDSITLPPVNYTAGSTAPLVGRNVVSAVASPTATNPANTVNMNGLELSYDLSLQTLASLGLNTNGRVHYEGNENIRIKTRFVFRNHLSSGGPAFVESEIVNQAYMTGALPANRFIKPGDYFAGYDTLSPDDIPNMDESKAFWCEDNGNFMTLVDYVLMPTHFNNFEPARLSNCSRVSRVHFRCEFPSNFDDYFPFEYRNFLTVDSVRMTVPPGYELTDTAVVSINTNGGGSIPCPSLTHYALVQKNGNIGTIKLNDKYFISNSCPTTASRLLVPLDERSWTNLNFNFRPVCNNTVADSVTGNKMEVYYNGLPHSTGYWSGQTTWSSQKSRKFTPDVTSNSMTYIAGTQSFEWDNLLQIRDTSKVKYPGGNSYHLDYHENAPNVFVIIKSKSGRFITTSIKDATTGVVTPYATNGVYKVNSLGALGNANNLPNFKNLLVSGKYNCVGMADSLFNRPDTLVMLFGWSCNGYPINAGDLYDGGCFVFDSVYHTITPRDVAMDIKMRTTDNTLDYCDQTPAQIIVRSTSLGYIYDAVSTIEFDRPGEMDLCTTQATARWKGQNYPVTATLLAPGKYQFDLSNLIGNAGLNDGDSIVINTCFKTKCAEGGQYNVHLTTVSEAYCGDILMQERDLYLQVTPYTPAQDDALAVNIQVPAVVSSCAPVAINVEVTNNGSVASLPDHLFSFLDTVIQLPSIAAGQTHSFMLNYVAETGCSIVTEDWRIENTDTIFCENQACYREYSSNSGSISFQLSFCGADPVISGNQTVCWGTNPIEVYSTNVPGPHQRVVWISSASLTPLSINSVSVSQLAGDLSLMAYFEDTLTGCISDTASLVAVEECCSTTAVSGGSCQGCDAYMTVQFDQTNPACVYITSCKNLSNVVLKDCFGNTYKFDGLTGLTGYFCMPSGNPITTVWVKSGCYKSGDGPGYGRRFEHPCAPCVKSLSAQATDAAMTIDPASLKVYPNPFKVETKIEYTANQSGHVSIEVFDLHGKTQGVLWSNNLESGETCRVQFLAPHDASSVYFVRVISASGEVIQQRVVYTP